MDDLPQCCWAPLVLVGIIACFRIWAESKVQVEKARRFDWNGFFSMCQRAILVIGGVISILLILDGVPGDEVVAALGTIGVAAVFQIIKPPKQEERRITVRRRRHYEDDEEEDDEDDEY